LVNGTIGFRDILAYALPGIVVVALFSTSLGITLSIEVLVLLGIISGYLLFPVFAFLRKVLFSIYPYKNKFIELSKRQKEIGMYDLEKLYYKMDIEKVKGIQNMLVYYDFYSFMSVILSINCLVTLILVVSTGNMLLTLNYYGINISALAVCSVSILLAYLSYTRALAFLEAHVRFMEFLVKEENIEKIAVSVSKFPKSRHIPKLIIILLGLALLGLWAYLFLKRIRTFASRVSE